MTEAVYERLAQHLDNLPGGFPRSETGVEMRILRRLFTEEEAELAVHLSLRPEPAAKIAARLDRDPEKVTSLLHEMSHKGLIFRLSKGKTPLYMASQYVVGIWEYHVNDLDPDLIRDMNEYLPTLIDMETWKQVPQLRTIPVGESVIHKQEVLPHEEARVLVRSRKKFAVAPCICRREHKMVGEGCDKPEETCLVFNRAADYYIENGLAREITLEEALGILDLAEENALVLHPSNAQNISNICACCGCCCQVLLAYKRHPNPSSIVSSPFQLEVDYEECVGCGDCIERCQMDALSLEDDVVALIEQRCIGCGLCTTVCPTECLTLVRKPEEDQKLIPENSFETYTLIAKARGKI